MSAVKRLSGLALLMALAGCINLAPKYHRPVPLAPDVWPLVNGRGAANAPAAMPVAQLGWRQFFLDGHLRHVVALALTHNQNLRIAALEIEKAREQYRQAGATLFPTIDASGNATFSKSGRAYGGGGNVSSRIINSSNVSKSESIALGFASFELDFFGALRNQKQAALELLRSSAATQRATQISLIGQVANDWLRLAADKELLQLARRTEANQRDNYRLVIARHSYGIATGADVADAKSSVESAREDVATDTTRVAQDRAALNLVAGTTIPAADLPAHRVPAHVVLNKLPAGVPSSVLENRPDVRAAEYTLRSDYANIGTARAAFFPTISLTASTGWATRGLTGLFKGRNRTWSFSPQIAMPIFDAGANRAALNITKIQRQIDVANYQQTIETAFREVADALATRATIHEQLAAQKALVAADQRAYDLSLAAFRQGINSYLDTLTEQRALYSAQRTEVNKRLSAATNLVTLYKVLGGGGLAETPAKPPAEVSGG